MHSFAKPINTRTNFKHVICPRYFGKEKKKSLIFFSVIYINENVFPNLSESKPESMTG
jgi:hypothetical protein